MIIRKAVLLWIFLLFEFQTLYAISLAEQFEQVGYAEMCNKIHTAPAFNSLYECFDEFIEFLQANPFWARKLYIAKERFIRSNDRDFYSSDFFGFYDESQKEGRNQISFYYSTHFHKFLSSQFPEFIQAPKVIDFLEACFEIQKPYGGLFSKVANELGIESIFASSFDLPPILLKVMKYLPSYIASRPHYDGTAFTCLLDSTDNQSILLSPYRSSFTIDDFFTPPREFSRGVNLNSIILMPGTLLTEYSIFPTPHIVKQSGKSRYATIAFAMRPYCTYQKIEFSSLPNFRL